MTFPGHQSSDLSRGLSHAMKRQKLPVCPKYQLTSAGSTGCTADKNRLYSRYAGLQAPVVPEANASQLGLNTE